jgi:prepilin-type N-terminal cleavage/methylation domain-containing protein
MRRSINARRTGRAGFTLIELLVVLAIIVTLVALTTAAAVRFMGSQYVSNTRTAISRLDSRLQQQLAKFLDDARKEGPSNVAQQLSGGSLERARVIHMKLKMQQYFPTTFAEALSPGNGNGYGAVPGYVSYLAQYGINSATNPAGTPAQKHESGACLYMILRYGTDTVSEEDAGLNAATKNINNVPVLVDGWSNPLVFCRWPVGAPVSFASPVNPQGVQSGFVDPLDPKGLLNTPSWLNTANGSAFQALCHPLPPRGSRNAPASSVNLAPVIASSGADGQLGLFVDPNDPNFVPPRFNPAGFPGFPLTEITPGNQSQANDNLYNR